MSYKIAYLTSDDPLDKRVSSGVYYYQSKALEKYCGGLHFLGPIKSPQIKLIRKSLNCINKFLKKRLNPYHSIVISFIYARIFKKKLSLCNCDFVFADKTSCEIAFLNTKVPIIYSTDATFSLLFNYYPDYTNLSYYSKKVGNLIEHKAIHRSEAVICTSSWAAESVHKDYGFPKNKIFVLPRGGNIDYVPDVSTVIDKKKSDCIRLLFVGKEWERKGYDVAFKTLNYIRSFGNRVKLTVIGFIPPANLMDKDVEVFSYIDKNTPSGMDQFSSIMLDADFLLLPTRAECLAIVFSEASAFGLISITRNIGGVSEVVKDGINGFALDYNADFRDFGDMILKIYNSDDEYYNLVKSSREYYDEKLSWDRWGMEMKKIVDGLFQKKQ